MSEELKKPGFVDHLLDAAGMTLEPEECEALDGYIRAQEWMLTAYKEMYRDHGKDTIGGLMARVKRLDEAEAARDKALADVARLERALRAADELARVIGSYDEGLGGIGPEPDRALAAYRKARS